jgi:uncharacterized protein HemX
VLRADRLLTKSELAAVDTSATGDLLLIAAVSSALVLGAGLLAWLRRRNLP